MNDLFGNSKHASDRLVVGTKVEVNYRGKGKYYPGVITQVRQDGTFDIDHDGYGPKGDDTS